MHKTEQFGLKWNFTYRSLLAILLVIRTLGLLTFIISLFNLLLNPYFDYNSYAWYICATIVTCILNTARIVYCFRLIKQLGSPTKETYYNLIIHFCLSIILSFFVGLLNQGFMVGIVASFFTLLCIIPNFIYYYKRRLWFGITFICEICGNEEKSNENYFIKNKDNSIECCVNCYNAQRRKNAKKSYIHQSKPTDNTVNTQQHCEHNNTEQTTSTDAHYCRKCGLKIDKDSIYCKHCGVKTTINICINCGCKLEADSVFCKNCGIQIKEKGQSNYEVS